MHVNNLTVTAYSYVERQHFLNKKNLVSEVADTKSSHTKVMKPERMQTFLSEVVDFTYEQFLVFTIDIKTIYFLV